MLKERFVLVKEHKTWHGTGRSLPSIRTKVCPLCMSQLEEVAGGQRCDRCRLWARHGKVFYGSLF